MLLTYHPSPGQKLPIWPLPTHGHGPGLKTPTTIGEALQDLPANDKLHDVAGHKQRCIERGGRALSIKPKNRPLDALIATAGAEFLLKDDDDGLVYWPTYREQLRLQGFPDCHTLTGSTIEDFTTQIGNAVPPRFMSVIFEVVLKALKESDQEVKEWRQEVVVVD